MEASINEARRVTDEAADRAEHADHDSYAEAARGVDEARRELAEVRRRFGFVGLAPSGVGIDT